MSVQWGRRLESWSNTAARLAGWRRVIQQINNYTKKKIGTQQRVILLNVLHAVPDLTHADSTVNWKYRNGGMTKWLGTHERMLHSSSKDDLMAYALYLLFLFVMYGLRAGLGLEGGRQQSLQAGRHRNRARIFKLLRSPRIDSKEPVPPGCEDWRAGTTTLFLLGS